MGKLLNLLDDLETAVLVELYKLEKDYYNLEEESFSYYSEFVDENGRIMNISQAKGSWYVEIKWMDYISTNSFTELPIELQCEILDYLSNDKRT